MSALIQIDDFYRFGDGDDWTAAFYRAQSALGLGFAPGGARSGFTLHFGARPYYFAETLQVLGPLTLLGSGGAVNPGTVLMFPKGTTGVVFHGPGTNLHPEYGGSPARGDGNAQGGTIEKMMLLAVDPGDRRSPAATSAMTDFREGALLPSQGAHGLVGYTQFVARDVTVSGFDGHGIYVFGNGDDDLSRPGTQSLAAFVRLDTVYSVGNGGDGLHIYGNDASGGSVTGSQFVHNAGWGIQDLNVIGQLTVQSGQTSYNFTGGVRRPKDLVNQDFGNLVRYLELYVPTMDQTQGDYQSRYDCYKEIIRSLDAVLTATPAPDPSAYPLVADPLPAWSGAWQAHAVQYVRFRDEWDAYCRQVGRALGDILTAAGLPADLVNPGLDPCTPYASSADVFLNVYAESNGPAPGTRNELSLVTMCINSGGLADGTDTLGWDPDGMQNRFFGAAGVAAETVKTPTVVFAAPASAAPHPPTIRFGDEMPDANHGLGAIVFNSAPVAGGPVGWVCLAGGNWREIGRVL